METILKRTNGTEIARGEKSLRVLIEEHGADLNWACLRGANLCGANLGGAHLNGANLRGAELDWACLRGANLGGANLAAAKNLFGSHDLICEILHRAARNEEQERWAAWPLLHREWCWDTWKKKLADAPIGIRAWAIEALCADPAWGLAEVFPPLDKEAHGNC